MKKQRVQKDRWAIASIAMACIAFSCSFFLKFDTVVTWVVTIVSALILLSLVEKLVAYSNEKSSHNFHLLWESCTLAYLVLAIYCIERGSYLSGQKYTEWLKKLLTSQTVEVEFQIGMLLFAYYIIILLVYGRTLWKVAREGIIKWIPNLWCLIIGIGFILYIKEGNSHMMRLMILSLTGLILIAYLLFKHLVNSEQKITYHIPAIHYLGTFGVGLILVVGIGFCIPDIQELPGTRWIRQIASTLNHKIDWNTKIPLQTKLDNEFPLSEAVLFEVNASEPLYLRDITYSDYQDGVWSIESEGGDHDSYIVLKPQYLHAEYLQTQSLLDEIAYQNSQNPDLFSAYAKIASYEASVTHKKKYTVMQNPINKINYFTVNGMLDILDETTTQIYYYKNINTCYFHGDIAIEPNNYTVEYYDHVPKRGSREYMFLRNISSTTWSTLYKQVVNNREVYKYEYSELPKLLLTYTPIVQYKNAQKNFLQVPKELKMSLESLARSVVLSQESDWEKAEMICTYLKSNYTYSLHSEYDDEEDRIYSFLFNNKEGICQEFASSMVLLCRSIGIPAKYVTGYLVAEKNPDTGHYIVREKDAHAFVEVYIAGYGWMTFDPTPEVIGDDTTLEEEVTWSRKDYIKGASFFLVLSILFIISRGGLFYLQKFKLHFALVLGKPEKQIVELVKCTIYYLEKRGYKRKAYETLSQYAYSLKQEEIDIVELIELYEAYIYGNKEIGRQEIKQGYQIYKRLKTKSINK